MATDKTAAKVAGVNRQVEQRGHERRYDTLCKVLDAICAEADNKLAIYHPPTTKTDAVIQARSRALLHLYLKAKFGLVEFEEEKGT